MKNKKQEYIEKEADDSQRHTNSASEEEFLEYIFTALGKREWLKGAM
jgi:hypothetical protein